MHAHGLIIFVLLLLFVGGQELNASCCSSASSNGIGRLLPHERAYIEFFNDARLALGTYDKKSAYKSGILRHLNHLQLSHELHAMARFTNFFLPFIKIPMKMSISTLKTRSYLGEITLGARWPIFGEGFFTHMPALSLMSSVQIPSDAQPYWLSLGFVLDKSFGGVNLILNYGISLDPTYFSKQGFKPGIKHALGLQTGFLIAENHRFSFTSALSLQGLPRNSKGPINIKYQTGLSISYAWAFHSHLTLLAGLGAHVPVSYFGRDSNSEVFAHAGLRVGIF